MGKLCILDIYYYIIVKKWWLYCTN